METGPTYESPIREDFEHCHPSEPLEDLKRRASFSKEDKGLLRDWMAVAAARASQTPSTITSATAGASPRPSAPLPLTLCERAHSHAPVHSC